MFWRADPNPETWRYKRRNTILGKWLEIKRSMWAQHILDCERTTMMDRLQTLYPDVAVAYWLDNWEAMKADDWIPF